MHNESLLLNFGISMTSRNYFRMIHRRQHPAHQGLDELKYWRPDKKWYHPMLCSSVVNFSKVALTQWNQLIFEGKERWDNIFEQRIHVDSKNEFGCSTGNEEVVLNKGEEKKANETQRNERKIPDKIKQGVLSFSNHVSLFDDPLLISNLGVSSYDDVRWIAADHKNFFGNNTKGLIYSGGKCVPIIRGGGLEQPGFDFLIQRLKMGEWVHIFPEGGRSREIAGLLQRPLKIGIGKLIYEARPLLMPFYHYGMHEILPIGSMFPKRGKKVHLKFGTAQTVDNNWWLQRLGCSVDKVEPLFAWQRATHWVEQVLLDLEKQVHPLSAKQGIL